MIQIEFWNGLTSSNKKYEKYNYLVTTKHNPNLWTNIGIEDKPWRNVYKKAIEYLEEWKSNKINDTEFLHSLRFVAYGYSEDGNHKREFINNDVIWLGNLSTKHKPRLVVKNMNEEFTIDFYFDNPNSNDPTENFWKTNITNKTDFYWPL